MWSLTVMLIDVSPFQRAVMRSVVRQSGCLRRGCRGMPLARPRANHLRRRPLMTTLVETDRTRDRNRMVDAQIARRGIRSEPLLQAFRSVPRERFVGEGMSEFAYEDTALPIEEEQTISQPVVVAHMIDAAEVSANDRVLEIGAGSGYAAAVLSLMARSVHAIERHARLAGLARERMKSLGYGNVEIRTGDGTLGWPEAA